jgi:hypothetical protein
LWSRLAPRELGPARSHEHFDSPAHQFRCKVVLAVGKTKFDRQVAPLDIAGLTEPLAKCRENAFFCVGVG